MNNMENIEDATAKREDAKTKVLSCEGEEVILLSLLRLCNFALSPSNLRAFAFLAHRDEVNGSICYTPGVGVRSWLKF